MTLWGSGEVYESYVGRWSRLVAPEFVNWLDIGPGLRWLDVGSGTGALSATVLNLAAPSSVDGVEPSAPFVEHARGAVQGAEFTVGGAEDLPFPDRTFDIVVSGLVLNFVPHPAAGVAEMTRVARPGGTVGAYVWDYAGEMQMMRVFWDAAIELDPEAAEADEGRRFPLCRPEALAAVFAGASLEGVETSTLDVPTRFRNFDDYWTPFLGATGPAPAYAASLSEAERAALRERIRAALPIADDGSIALTARAWAVRGRRPGDPEQEKGPLSRP